MKRSSRRLLIAIAAIVLLTVTVSAYYIKISEEVNNTFSPADAVTPNINEEFSGNNKQNVYVEVGNTGYPVYVRAAIIITWKKDVEESDDSGNVTTTSGVVYFDEPSEASAIDHVDPDTGTTSTEYVGDYVLLLNLEDWDWNSDDGYYYYKKRVESSGRTSNLINLCYPLENGPDGYTLSVEIIAQTIQAIGYTDETNPKGEIPAYQDAWGLHTSIPEESSNIFEETTQPTD